jgi:hypothetical protein
MTYPICILIGFILVTAVYFIVRFIRCMPDSPKPLSCIASVCCKPCNYGLTGCWHSCSLATLA